jgi:hypothetical protein
MNSARPRFSLPVWFYLVTFFSLLGFLPIILTVNNGPSNSVAGSLDGVNSLACDDRRFVGLRRPPVLK